MNNYIKICNISLYILYIKYIHGFFIKFKKIIIAILSYVENEINCILIDILYCM